MNKDKLKEFVNALDGLSDEVKDWDVDMESSNKPSDSICGCHAGLVSIVAKDLPELQDIYNRLCSLHCDIDDCNHLYFYYVWADALAVFLGFTDSRDLRFWAENNPKLWGNKFGSSIFRCEVAFTYGTNDSDKGLTHRDIIEHWKQVLVNIEEGGKLK